MSKKILLVASQHGNEYLGERLLMHIIRHRTSLLDDVDFLVANPRARVLHKRFVDSDMNRSYGNGTGYESKRAKVVLKYIKINKPKLVIDLHTTNCKQPPCFIVAGIRSRCIIYASSIEHIVSLPEHITKNSLIGVTPEAVSIEVNRLSLNHALLDKLCDDLERYLAGQTITHKRYLYTHVYYLLKNDISSKHAARLRNFERTTDGGYPILVGENSYKKHTNYLGFCAKRRKVVRL